MMSWYDVILITVAYACLCTGQAFYQANQFANQKPISHVLHGIYYAIACLIVGLVYWNALTFLDGLKAGIYGGVLLLAFFDTILNSIRGKELWYNGEDDGILTKEESLQNWWENKIWRLNEPGGKRRLLILKICYLIVWAAYVILIF